MSRRRIHRQIYCETYLCYFHISGSPDAITGPPMGKAGSGHGRKRISPNITFGIVIK
jgi:hypothetical protein